MKETTIAQEVLEIANSIPGVKAAATGDLKVTNLDVKTESESDQAVAPSDEEQTKEEPTQAPVKEKEPKPVSPEEKVPSLPLLQAQVDDADARVVGSTLEPVSKC